MDVYHEEIHSAEEKLSSDEAQIYVQHEEHIDQNEEHDSDEDHLDDDIEEEIIEYVEEFSYGQIVHGEDNQYYVVMDEDTPEFDFEKLNNVRVILNEDGTKTLLMENTTQKEALLNDPSVSTNFNDNSYLGHSSRKRKKMGEDHVEFDGEHDTFSNDMIANRGFANGKRHSRVYGDYKCPECDQAFVNTARLERHLAVHQVFGSFLCPLCGKTYKYEYNLFYHWRRTCRDMNDLLSYNDRKNMEVTNLRQLVEEIAQKKANIGPLELSLSSAPPERLNHDGEEGESGVAPISDMDPSVSEGSYVVPPHQRNVAGLEMDEKWLNDDALIFADDLIHDDDMLMINEEGHLRSMADVQGGIVTSGAIGPNDSYARGGGREYAETNVNPSNVSTDVNMYTAIHPLDAEECYVSRGTTQAVQCGECFRSFANIARLERHLASAHSSYGTHHCQLCGSRFKYEYNLLYHIRRVCQYAKDMIDSESREQLPAANLKKLMRTLASQDIVRMPADQISAMTFNHKPDLGDAVIREQMMKSVMPHYRASSSAVGGDQPMIMAPPPTYQSQLPRPGFPEGKKCPVCSIIFYGVHILARHIKVAHPAEYEVWAPQLAMEGEQEEYRSRGNYKQTHVEYESDTYEEPVRSRRYLMSQSSSMQNSKHYGDGSTMNIEEEETQLQSTSAGGVVSMPRQHLPLRGRMSSAHYVREDTEYTAAEVDQDEEYVSKETQQQGDLTEIEPPPSLQPEPEVDDSHMYSYNMPFM